MIEGGKKERGTEHAQGDYTQIYVRFVKSKQGFHVELPVRLTSLLQSHLGSSVTAFSLQGQPQASQ